MQVGLHKGEVKVGGRTKTTPVFCVYQTSNIKQYEEDIITHFNTMTPTTPW